MLSLSQLACAFVVPTLLEQAGADSPLQLHQVKAPESKGAVASESSICSNIGLDLIKQGGNAADAVSAGFRRARGTQLTNASSSELFSVPE